MIHDYILSNAVPFVAMRYLWLYQGFYQRMRQQLTYSIHVEPTISDLSAISDLRAFPDLLHSPSQTSNAGTMQIDL